MVKLLIDTNILIDYLNGIDQAKVELRLQTDKAISMVTWMEVMDGATAETASVVKAFLGEFKILPMDERVAELAIKLRSRQKIRLSDAIVWATAQSNSRILVTRNTQDFTDSEPGVRIPYQI